MQTNLSTKIIEGSSDSEKKIYFANLDVIRFIAAFLVLLFHIEIKRKQYNLDFFDSFFFSISGDYGVTIFFVLSGFLITYLLLSEKQKTNTINIPKFYVRRILRIWPLYYLIVLLGFFVLPHSDIFYIPQTSALWTYLTVPTFLLYVIFLPNMVVELYGNMPYLDQTWSIGVEEQYYLFWPLIMKKSKDSIFKFVIFICCTIFFSKTLILLLDLGLVQKSETMTIISNFLYHERFTCMGMGGLGAFLLFNRGQFPIVIKFLQQKSIQIITLLFIAFFFIMGLKTRTVSLCTMTYLLMWIMRYRFHDTVKLFLGILFFLCMYKLSAYLPTTVINNTRVKLFDNEILSVLFCISILNFAIPATSIINIKNKALLYLGRISYGIYMFHNIVIVFCLYMSTKLFSIPYNRFFVYPAVIVLTILLSALSYELFEKHFLKIKKKYMIVKSGA